MRQDKVDMYKLQEMVRLHRAGVGHREVAPLLEMSPNTERKYRRALMGAGLYEGSVDELATISLAEP